MGVNPVEITNKIIADLADELFRNVPGDLGSSYRPQCGLGTLPPTIDPSSFIKMYKELEIAIAAHGMTGVDTDTKIFLKSFANSITAHQIELLSGDEDKGRWTKVLERYWEKVGFSTYQSMAEQCDAFLSGLRLIEKDLPKQGQKCVAIPVLPIGNVIFVETLRALYERNGWFVFLPIWNLPRNDRRRKSEVKRLVAELGSNGNVLIHYVDECKSGTNMSKLVEAILGAGWPRERLMLTAVGTESASTKGTLNAGEQFRESAAKAIYFKDIVIPRARLGFIDRDGADIFLENKSRLAGWRKISCFQVLGEIIDKFKLAGKNGEESLIKILGEDKRPLILAGLSEIEQLVRDEKIFSEKMEGMYETQFIGSPYIIDSFDQRLFSALHKEEMVFISENVKASLPMASVILSLLSKEGVGEVSPIYFLKPWRRDSKLPYNLIRLDGNEAAPARCFVDQLKKRL